MTESLPGIKASVRSYDAGGTLPRYGDLLSSSKSADSELVNAIVPLRNKSRNLYRNSAAQRRYVQLMRVNIVGENGFRLHSRVRKGDGALDKPLNARTQEEWNEWWEHPTVDGHMTGTDLERQAVSSWCNDGEVIWEIVYGLRYPSGIAINPIEPDMLDETLITINPETQNEIRMGVEVNSDGRPVAYWFLTDHPGDLHGLGGSHSRNRHRRVSADRVLHLYDRVRPGQTRGEPPAAPVIHPVKILDGYREAEVTGRRLRAAIMGFFTKDVPTSEGIGQLADREADRGEDWDNTFEMDISPGTLKSLPYGYQFQQFDPGGMQADYQDFEAQIKKDQAMGYGISTFSHGMETAGVSYSTGRSVLTEDRDFYKQMQNFFIGGLYNRLFPLWLSRRVLENDSRIPATRLPLIMRAKQFRARGWDWVDPAKEVSANAEALRTKQTSLTRVAAGRGIDLTDLLDEIEEEQALAAERGLTLDYENGTSDDNSEDNDDDD